MSNRKIFNFICEYIEKRREALHSDTKNNSCSATLTDLQKESCMNFGDDIDKWVDWFCNHDIYSTKKEISYVNIIFKIYSIEKKALRKMSPRRAD